MFLLHDSPIAVGKMKRTLSERGIFKKRHTSSAVEVESCISDTCSVTSRETRQRRFTFHNATSQSAASFYLRIGAIGK